MNVNENEVQKFFEILNRHHKREYYTFQLYFDDITKANPQHLNKLKQLIGYFSVTSIYDNINYKWFKGRAIDLLANANMQGMAVTMQCGVFEFGKRTREHALYATHFCVDYEIEAHKEKPNRLFDDMEAFLGYLEDSACPPEMANRTSSGKCHVWLPLVHQGIYTDKMWLDWSKGQDLLLREFSSDRSCKDPSRVFRVPGFYHMKGSPSLVKVHWEQEVEKAYTVEEVMDAYGLSLNSSRVQVLAGTQHTQLDPKIKEIAKKYEHLDQDIEVIDDHSWETPEVIAEMISFLPTKKESGYLREWKDWVAVGTAIARKFVEKKRAGLKEWKMSHAKEIFLNFCKSCPHYQSGKYDPVTVWQASCIPMSDQDLPSNYQRYTMASVVDEAMNNGWVRPNALNKEVELVQVEEVVVEQADGTKVKKKVLKKLQIDPDLLENIELNDYWFAQIVSRATKDCLKYHNGIGWIMWNKKFWNEQGEDIPPYAIISQVYMRLKWMTLRKMAKICKKPAWKGQRKLRSKRNNEGKNAVEGQDYRFQAFDRKYKPLEKLVQYLKDTAKSEHKLRAVSKICKTFARSRVETDELDKHEHLFCVQNGVIDLRNGAVMPHAECVGDLITKIAPVKYELEAPEPVEWLKFLNSVFEGNQELIEFVQCAIGYSMTGSAKERCLFLLHGNGRNGKSTFVNAIRNIFGHKYSTTIAADVLTGRTNNNQIPVGVAKLRGMRMASTAESDENQRLKEGTIKSITGDDTITARFMRQNEFEFRCFTKILFPTNHLPQVRGDDDGIWDRIKLIEFNMRYHKQSEPEKAEKYRQEFPDKPIEYVDTDLPKKLADEVVGILDWCVQGARKWYANGLPRCKVIDDASKKYREDQDKFKYFVENFVEITGRETDRITITELRQICEEQTGFRYTSQTFKKLMEKKGIKTEQSSRGEVAVGVITQIRSFKGAKMAQEGIQVIPQYHDNDIPL